MPLKLLLTISLAAIASQAAATDGAQFTEEELSVATFWEQMGPTLRDEGIEAYAMRYHEDFRHWDIGGTGRIGGKESAIRAWSGFHEAGHRITCTHVEPVTIDIYGDHVFARLIYEQTDTYADGRVSAGVWHMATVFKRYGDTWQMLESNMVNITPKPDESDDNSSASEYEFTCPTS